MKKENQQTYIEESSEKISKVGTLLEAETFFKTPSWALSYNFPYNPDPLCYGNNYATYDEMIDDDQVKAVLNVKKDMVVNTGWDIVGDKDDVNDYIRENLNNIDRYSNFGNSFDDILRDILSAYGYGFSLSEPIYKIEKGKYILIDIKVRAPHSFKLHINDKGDMIKIEQSTVSGAPKDFNPAIFLHHIHQMEFGNPYGKSDLKAAYNAWKAKKFFNKFFAIYIEKFASPTAIGKYPKGYSKTEIEEFHAAIKTIQNSTTLTLPDDTMFAFEQLKSDASQAYIGGINHYNMQIARSVLVPDLLGLGGSETKGGSYALGKEQFKLFLSTIQKDRDSLSQKITNKIIRSLVNANFGDIKCRFIFKPYKQEDVIEYLKVWVSAVTGQAFTPNDEEINYLRMVLGFPEGEVKIPIKTPFNPTNQFKLPEIKEINYKLNRALNSYEKKVDFKHIEEYLDTEEEKIIKKLNINAKYIYSDLISQIREKNIITNFKPNKLDNLSPKFLRDMNIVLRDYFDDLYKESYTQAQTELMPENEKKYTMPSDKYLELIRIQAFKMVGDYATDMLKRAKNIILQSVKDGYKLSDIMGMLRNDMEASSMKWIDTSIRTVSTEIYNEARKQYWEQDDYAKQIVEAYQWSSVMDTRTSDICEYMDGKIFDIGELSDWLKPPAHFNCRSVLVPITKFEEYETTPTSKLEIDKLLEKGGNLLRPTKYELTEPAKPAPQKPNILISGLINSGGDTMLIAPAGVDKRINILGIYIINNDKNYPCVISFKCDKNEEVKYTTNLNKMGGVFQKEFNPAWLLESDNGFILTLSASAEISYTIEYIITDLFGMRVD